MINFQRMQGRRPQATNKRNTKIVIEPSGTEETCPYFDKDGWKSAIYSLLLRMNDKGVLCLIEKGETTNLKDSKIVIKPSENEESCPYFDKGGWKSTFYSLLLRVNDQGVPCLIEKDETANEETLIPLARVMDPSELSGSKV